MARGISRIGGALERLIDDSEGIGEREIRRLINTKQKKVVLTSGFPISGSGRDGDIKLNNTPKGIKLYARFNGRWYGFTPDFIENSEIGE